MRAIIVEATGPLMLIEDLGRPGMGRLGVSRSGAFDRGSLMLANRLVGNDPAAPALEILMGGARLRAGAAMTIAVTGASGPLIVHQRGGNSAVKPIAVDRWAPIALADGDVLELPLPRDGLRSYLAVRGGLEVPSVLGSCAHDVLADLGPAPVSSGDRLAIGARQTHSIKVDHVPAAPPPTTLDLIPGPHLPARSLNSASIDLPDTDVLATDPLATGLFATDLLALDALDVLTSGSYLVEPSSNRIGVRLRGQPIPRRPGELASAPMRPGAIQVPGDGQPVILGPDAPVTGGFPVIATLTAAALDAVGQARPGERLRFRVRPSAGGFIGG